MTELFFALFRLAVNGFLQRVPLLCSRADGTSWPGPARLHTAAVSAPPPTGLLCSPWPHTPPENTGRYSSPRAPRTFAPSPPSVRGSGSNLATAAHAHAALPSLPGDAAPV